MISDFSERFAGHMRVSRARMNLTQQDVVTMLKEHGINVTQGYLSLIESGERRDPRAKVIIGLAYVLNISIDGILNR